LEEKYHSLYSNFLPSAITVMDWSNTYLQVSVMIITLSHSEFVISFFYALFFVCWFTH